MSFPLKTNKIKIIKPNKKHRSKIKPMEKQKISTNISFAHLQRCFLSVKEWLLMEQVSSQIHSNSMTRRFVCVLLQSPLAQNVMDTWAVHKRPTNDLFFTYYILSLNFTNLYLFDTVHFQLRIHARGGVTTEISPLKILIGFLIILLQGKNYFIFFWRNLEN